MLLSELATREARDAKCPKRSHWEQSKFAPPLAGLARIYITYFIILPTFHFYLSKTQSRL